MLTVPNFYLRRFWNPKEIQGQNKSSTKSRKAEQKVEFFQNYQLKSICLKPAFKMIHPHLQGKIHMRLSLSISVST